MQLFLSGHNSYYTSGNNQIFVQNWLNGDGSPNQGPTVPNSARSDWVNHTYTGSTVSGTFVHGDGDPVSYGCALAFIYYLTNATRLHDQRGHREVQQQSCELLPRASRATRPTRSPTSSALVNHVYPSGRSRATLSGTNPNNLFPIAQVEFYAQKNTFGKDEAQDIINHQGGLISSAFWVVIDGMSKQAFQNLGVQVGPFTGAFAGLSGVHDHAEPGRCRSSRTACIRRRRNASGSRTTSRCQPRCCRISRRAASRFRWI